jgi:hypothetical protein
MRGRKAAFRQLKPASGRLLVIQLLIAALTNTKMSAYPTKWNKAAACSSRPADN